MKTNNLFFKAMLFALAYSAVINAENEPIKAGYWNSIKNFNNKVSPKIAKAAYNSWQLSKIIAGVICLAMSIDLCRETFIFQNRRTLIRFIGIGVFATAGISTTLDGYVKFRNSIFGHGTKSTSNTLGIDNAKP